MSNLPYKRTIIAAITVTALEGVMAANLSPEQEGAALSQMPAAA
jgi:hypothetical protein